MAAMVPFRAAAGAALAASRRPWGSTTGRASVSGGGGGSGGSIWLTVGALSGAGFITANGGSGVDAVGGGGGGGRISISYNNNSFAGPVSAYGGGGANWGGAGTVYLKTNSQSYGQLTLDNGGNTGINTTFNSSLTLRKIPEGTEIKVALPPNARLSLGRWSPDATRFAFTNTTDRGIERSE